LKQAEDAEASAASKSSATKSSLRSRRKKTWKRSNEARARLKQLRETFDLKRKASRLTCRVLEIQRDRALNAMSHAQNNAESWLSVRR